MRILTLDNKSYHLNNLPEEIEDDFRFSVLDNSDLFYSINIPRIF